MSSASAPLAETILSLVSRTFIYACATSEGVPALRALEKNGSKSGCTCEHESYCGMK